MRSEYGRTALARLALIAVLAGMVAAAPAAEPSAQDWLQRMAEASRVRNYDGTFVYRHEGGVEAVSIVHSYAHGRERERIVHLNGTPREVLRDAQGVTCILPDDQSVVVGGGAPPSPLVLEVGDNLARLQNSYQLSLGPVERVANRQAQRVTLRPRDAYRYGFELWVDMKSHLLLRSDLLDGTDRPLEQIMFVTLNLRDAIPESALQPTIGVKGWQWYEEDGARSEPQVAADPGWKVQWLPEGFAPTGHDVRYLQRIPVPVQYLGFSDGLASLSVFIELRPGEPEAAPATTSMGAVHAYSGVVDGHRVTVMGEVPGPTVVRVAESVRHVQE